jgi:hypothetical protein
MEDLFRGQPSPHCSQKAPVPPRHLRVTSQIGRVEGTSATNSSAIQTTASSNL